MTKNWLLIIIGKKTIEIVQYGGEYIQMQQLTSVCLKCVIMLWRCQSYKKNHEKTVSLEDELAGLPLIVGNKPLKWNFNFIPSNRIINFRRPKRNLHYTKKFIFKQMKILLNILNAFFYAQCFLN